MGESDKNSEYCKGDRELQRKILLNLFLEETRLLCTKLKKKIHQHYLIYTAKREIH